MQKHIILTTCGLDTNNSHAMCPQRVESNIGVRVSGIEQLEKMVVLCTADEACCRHSGFFMLIEKEDK